MSDDSDADQKRDASIYEREQMVPERLLHDLADTPVLPEEQINMGKTTLGSHRGSLTAAERLVVTHLSHGLSVPMIAELLQKGESTVATQVKSARASLNAKTATHLVAIALRQGLIE